MKLIKNGLIIEDNQLIKKDILIEDDLIVKIDDCIEKDCLTINADGCLVMPGAVDVHVHLREPGFEHKETVTRRMCQVPAGDDQSVVLSESRNQE